MKREGGSLDWMADWLLGVQQSSGGDGGKAAIQFSE